MSTTTRSEGAGSTNPVASTGGSSTDASTTAVPGKGLPASQLVAKADKICMRLNSELADAKSNVQTQKDLRRVASQREVFEQTALTRLSKLVPPASISSEWQQMIADRRLIIRDLNKISAYADINDDSAEQPVYASSAILEQQMLAMAERGGFKVCGQVG